MCNLLHLRQLGLQHGHLQDFGPDFGVSYISRRPCGDGAEVMTARRSFAAALVAAVSLGTAGCATNGLSQPAAAASRTERGRVHLTAIFENALNVPALAKVRLAGADVRPARSPWTPGLHRRGQTSHRQRCPVAPGSTVELRSATPLGDVFIAVKPAQRPANGAILKDGDTIGLDHTGGRRHPSRTC